MKMTRVNWRLAPQKTKRQNNFKSRDTVPCQYPSSATERAVRVVWLLMTDWRTTVAKFSYLVYNSGPVRQIGLPRPLIWPPCVNHPGAGQATVPVQHLCFRFCCVLLDLVLILRLRKLSLCQPEASTCKGANGIFPNSSFIVLQDSADFLID
jgi:hypothetical protein